MYRVIQSMCFGAAMLAGFGVPMVAQAQQGGADVEAKQIRIESQGGPLQLDVTGIKSEYAVGEPIDFQVRGNRTFYLWAYARDPNGEAVLLVPSQLQSGNKYRGGRGHQVPNPGLRFVADETGPHEITLIASTRWLDLDFTRRVSANSDKAMTFKAASLDEAFQEKGIRIERDGDRSASGDANTVVLQKAFDVSGESLSSGAPPSAGALAFVRMDRADYRIGERFRLLFGATEDGYVHVFLREPSGDLVRLLEREVSADRIYEEQGTITEPSGRQGMLAFYSRDGRLERDWNAKGVALDRDLPETAAAYEFTVSR